MALILFAVTAALSTGDARAEEIKHIQIKEMGTETKLPSKIWELVEKIGVQSDDANAKKKQDDLVGSLYVGSMGFAPIQVRFKEKTQGLLLVGAEFSVGLPVGGGDIDLNQYLKKKQGTFYLNFDFEGDEDPENMQVYFVSKLKKRRIDDEVFGMGCNKFVNITSYYLKKIKGNELALNTTRNRHLSVVGGTFVFAYKKKQQYRVAQVTFKDSLQPEYFCDQTASKENPSKAESE